MDFEEERRHPDYVPDQQEWEWKVTLPFFTRVLTMLTVSAGDTN